MTRTQLTHLLLLIKERSAFVNATPIFLCTTLYFSIYTWKLVSVVRVVVEGAKVGLLCRMRLSVNGNFFEIPIERNGLHDSAPDITFWKIASHNFRIDSPPKSKGPFSTSRWTQDLWQRDHPPYAGRGKFFMAKLSYVISVSGSFPAFCGGLVMLQIRLYWASGTRLVSQHKEKAKKKMRTIFLFDFTCFIDNFLSHWP